MINMQEIFKIAESLPYNLKARHHSVNNHWEQSALSIKMPQLKILPATRLCSNKGSAKTLRWYVHIYYLGNLNNNAGSIGDAVPAHLHGCSWSLLRKKLVPRFKLDITSFSITPNIITKSSSSRFKGQRWNGFKFWEVLSFVLAFKIQFLNSLQISL
jgi:hypothetical protein